jgi:3-mercaptopyruvate sulfurtransferase SseA
MRSLILLAVSLLLGLALLASVPAGQQGSGGSTAKEPETKATPPAQAAPADGVPRITVAEAREALEKGTAIIVDVRSESSYHVGHILGALWMPDIASRTKELPRDKMIITYCS